MAKKQDWISTAEAAAIMGVSDRFVRMLIADGAIEHMPIGNRYAVSRKAAEQYRRQRTPKNQGDS